MFRRSSNNTFIPPNGLNGGSFPKLGNSTDELGERYPGLLGSTLVLDDGGALKYSNPTVGTLYNGVYQMVKLTTAITRGQIVYWDTAANNGFADFEVRTVGVSATERFKAGVAICNGTSGEYAWIQVSGIATCQYSSTSGATDLNALVFVDFTVNPGQVTALADSDSTAITINRFKSLVGVAYEAPVVSTLKRVVLNLAGFYQNIA